MTAIICPSCDTLIGHIPDSDTKLVRGICPDCGAQFTAENGLAAVEGWVRWGAGSRLCKEKEIVRGEH